MIQIREHVSVASHTTLRIGGDAQFFCEAHTIEELREAIAYAHAEGLPLRIIGGGSNILCADGTLPGLWVRNSAVGFALHETDAGPLLVASSGTILDEMISWTCEQGLWGLENLSGIPGTVGATPIQNVGAYGVEVSDRIAHIDIYDMKRGVSTRLSPDMCRFGYRHSWFKEGDGSGMIIESVAFHVSRSAKPVLSYRELREHFSDVGSVQLTPQAVRDAVVAIRNRKFPDWHVVGTAGSFFKNPTIPREQFERLLERYPGLIGHDVGNGNIKVSLGWILDHVCGLRGVREGNVGLYHAQALVLVHYGGATCDEVNAFAKRVAADVAARTGIRIEREVTLLA